MVDALLIAEDDAQEQLVRRLAERIAHEAKIPFQLRLRATRGRGGIGAVKKTLRQSCHEWRNYIEPIPDVVIVAVDANCHGIPARRAEIDAIVGEFADRTVHAIADPHIERWLLLDGNAFKTVVGKGCQAPDQKCEKDRYKRLLVEAVRAADIRPTLDGIEFAEDIASHMDLHAVQRLDEGVRLFVEELRRALRR